MSDLYLYSIKAVKNELLKTNTLESELIKLFDKIVTRKTIKKPIMTANYNVSYRQSWEYFNKGIAELNISPKDLINRTSDIIFIHRAIHNFSMYGMFSNLFIENKEEFLENFNNKFEFKPIYRRNGGTDIFISYDYYIVGKHKFKRITNKDESIKIQEYYLTNEIDYTKTKRALNANLIHTQDSLLSDHLAYSVRSFQIHDSFSSSIYDTHTLMDESNKYFRSRLERNNSTVLGQLTYSPFILV